MSAPDTGPACRRSVTPVDRARSCPDRVRSGPRQWGHGRPPRDRQHPRRARLVPVPRRRGPGHLRREGQEPAQPAVELLRAARHAARAHPPDGADGRPRRVDRRQERGRGVLPRVQPHQAAQAALQHPAEGRQVVPVPRGHARRGVAAGDGDARQKRKGVRYFGPFAHAYAIRETLDLLLRTFPIRTCTNTSSTGTTGSAGRASTRTSRSARRRASATSTTTSTTELVQELLDFLDGEHDAVIERLEQRMREAADELEFERAARRARPARQRAQGHRAPADGRRPRGGLRPHRARRGRARSERAGVLRAQGPGRRRKGLIVDKVEDVETPALVARVVEQLYADAPTRRRAQGDPRPGRARRPRALRGVPRAEPRLEGAHPRAAARRQARAARRPRCSTRARRSQRHKLQRASDHNARARALVALQEALDLPEAPLRIECFDISNLQGTEIVASMVVMEDGSPKRSDYRRFKVRDARRPGRLRVDGRGAHPPLPQLPPRARRRRARRASGSRTRRTCSLIDGGKGQLDVAVRVLEELGLEDICVASLAKRFEEVYLPGPSPSRCASRATPRRSTCCSRCATRRTASRSRTTASCAARR